MAAYSYEYKVKRLYDVPAQVVGELCEQLQESESGLTPKSFVEASRDENAPTHSMLEWNDDIAAEKYREEQAKHIIANIKIVREEETEGYQERGFVSIPGGQSVYVSLQSALSNDEWRKNLLKQAMGEMECFIAKYRRLSELAEVIEAMEKAQAAVG